jgi:hypothetical protein
LEGVHFVNGPSLAATLPIVTGVAEPVVRETIDATRRTRLANERLVLGLRRERSVEAALERGIFAPLGRLAVLGLAVGGVALGVLTFVLVVVSP